MLNQKKAARKAQREAEEGGKHKPRAPQEQQHGRATVMAAKEDDTVSASVRTIPINPPVLAHSDRPVTNTSVTGRSEWANTGGLIGIVLTLADTVSSSLAAIEEDNQKTARPVHLLAPQWPCHVAAPGVHEACVFRLLPPPFEWANTGGLIGIVLTLADTVSSSLAAIEEDNQKKETHR
jgi:hypothetical protein